MLEIFRRDQPDRRVCAGFSAVRRTPENRSLAEQGAFWLNFSLGGNRSVSFTKTWRNPTTILLHVAKDQWVAHFVWFEDRAGNSVLVSSTRKISSAPCQM